MFDVSPWEMIAIAVIGLLVFGPDKLPKLAADAVRLLREVRRMASGAQQELKQSLGPELADLDLAELNPRTFVKRNLLDPVNDEVDQVKRVVNDQPEQRKATGADPADGSDYDADTT